MTDHTSKYITATVLVIMTLVLGPVACTIHKNEQVVHMVKSGVDPRIAKCAVDHNPDYTCPLLPGGAK